MDKPSLKELFDYHYWANHQLWPAVMALSDEQFTQPRDEGPSIHAQIIQMVANENLWVNYLWHGEVEFLQEKHLPTRDRIRAEWDALEEEIRDFIDEVMPAELESIVKPPFLNGGALRTWEALMQVIHRAAESRAQLRLQLRHLGLSVPAQDFLDFLTAQPSAPPNLPAQRELVFETVETLRLVSAPPHQLIVTSRFQ